MLKILRHFPRIAIFLSVFLALLAGSVTYASVTLVRFEGAPSGERIRIEWQTASELNNAGFFIRRSNDALATDPFFDFVRIHLQNEAGVDEGDFVPPRDSLVGAVYTFYDGDIASGETYYYLLESIDTNDNIEYHGPITITAGTNSTSTPIPTNTDTPTSTPSATSTGTLTATPSPGTPDGTVTATRTPSLTNTPAPTYTPSLTPLVSPSLTNTPEPTQTPTSTNTPTLTPSPDILQNLTAVAGTLTAEAELKSSPTPGISDTPTPSLTPTLTITVTLRVPSSNAPQESGVPLRTVGVIGVLGLLIGGLIVIGVALAVSRKNQL